MLEEPAWILILEHLGWHNPASGQHMGHFCEQVNGSVQGVISTTAFERTQADVAITSKAGEAWLMGQEPELP